MARKPVQNTRRRRAPRPAEADGFPIWKIALAIFIVLILTSSGWILYQHGRAWAVAAHEKFISVTANAGLRVEDIYIEGRKDLSREQLLAKIAVERGTPLFSVDTRAVQSRLLELQPVHDARVTRLWPDRLLVQIQERVPIALWQKDGKLMPIDRDGVALTYQRAENFSNLPVVVGDDAPKQTNELLAALDAYPELKSLVLGATYVGDRRWDLFLKSGMQIKLPEGDVAAGLKRLMDFANEQMIFGKPIAAVDLRLPDRVVVKPLPPAEPQPADARNPETLQKPQI